VSVFGVCSERRQSDILPADKRGQDPRGGAAHPTAASVQAEGCPSYTSVHSNCTGKGKNDIISGTFSTTGNDNEKVISL